MHGHAIDVGKDECSAGHISLFKSIKCPIASCGFQSEPRYAHVDIPLDQSYHEVKVHFKSVHGYALDSPLLDLKESDNVVTESTNVEKKSDSCNMKDNEHQEEVIENAKKVDVDPKTENVPTCPHCYKIMRTKFTLRRHVRQVHEDKERFNCLYCDKTFCSKFSMTYHTKKNHQSSLDNYVDCEQCGKVFSNFQAYRAHREDHRASKEKDTTNCHYCDLEIQRASLRRHIAEVHNIEIRIDAKKVVCKPYPYICNKCDQDFKRQSDLQRHKLAKHGGHMYKCDVCTKQFKYLTNLRRHAKMIHDAGLNVSKQNCKTKMPNIT